MEVDGPEERFLSMEDLPDEIHEIIQLQQTPRFHDSLAAAALKPKLTLKLFTLYENVFADICARWIVSTSGERQDNESVEAFARILPLAPHLSTFLEKYLRGTNSKLGGVKIEGLWASNHGLGTLELQRLLLATFRLLNFDRDTYSKAISGAKIQDYLQHDDRTVRYLAVRILCQILSAADFKLDAMIEEYVGNTEVIMGDYDGVQADYGFLSLFEQKRLQDAHKSRLSIRDEKGMELPNFGELSPFVVRYGSIFLPRPNGHPSSPSTMITTTTTAKNMECFASSLLSTSPILLHGLAGSGKTSLVNDFARELGFEANMVTLHLNEQTDAKMLIGVYATGSTPGSFAWRAGILTTAVREGRWVFIEDLDRAPNEVISAILPLIERSELLIPSRGETIKAGRGFRLLASIRTSLSVTGRENPPALHMLGARLWKRVPIQMPSQDEFREIILGTYPILNQFLPGIINVYQRLYSLSQKPSFASRTRTSLGRPLSPRDLLKWCSRLEGVLLAAGSKTGREPISESTQYAMFQEATDCFAGSLQTEDARRTIIFAIAEEMHIDPQRAEHFITAHIPRYEETEEQLVVGRVRLQKRLSRVTKTVKKRPFTNTSHAKRLLEQVGVAVKLAEPVLLVGETGIGKTTIVQQLADALSFKLTAVNLSQQSEVGDLLGGFKPVNVRTLAVPLKEEFDDLFTSTGISATKNQKYLEQIGKCVAKGQWNKASKLWREAPKMFEKIIAELEKKDASNADPSEKPAKRRKTVSKLQSLIELKPRWDKFSENLDQFDIQLSGGSKGFAFTFIEGNIVKAARNGDWVLLDEINLASPDTLESIADLLQASPSILLSETGEVERIRAHPNFRIFGAMNPATDVGKRDLPTGLRSRFTEFYVDSPDRNLDDLLGVIKAYLKSSTNNDERAAQDVAKLYLNTKRLADEKRLVDGANQVPHFSLRTLTRVLSYVNEITPLYGLRRALYEGFSMGFLTLLDRESEKLLVPLIDHHLLSSHKNIKGLLSQSPKHPEDGRPYVPFMSAKKDRHYWLLQGMETPQIQTHYIRTPSVDRNMLNLVRATSTRRFPVLVQGPTSSGKTSMIEYLAKHSGNKFVRINNHEHTDLQEYLGTYVSGLDGQLRFQEGLLVQALRQGHWIVLDELNLAPTEVLEALNRLLDDNRELLIPETQEIVRPHENFMLFATQNPPGLYGGRKTLSRAFRNRFLELHFDDIPEDELETILQTRCQNVAPSDCGRIVKIYQELSRLRQTNRLFEQKDSFATLRDLFRWALRAYDTREQLAANGYMLLGERVRNPEERIAVKEIIEKVMKVKIDTLALYDSIQSTEIEAYNQTSNSQGVVWTQAMRRLYVLVAHALRNNEPVLLVGETGCGKTTVCQMLADAFQKELHIVNAHQNTETGDLIGAQRPVRNRAAILAQLKEDLLTGLKRTDHGTADDLDSLITSYKTSVETSDMSAELRQRINLSITKSKSLFEWSDGSLVQAMRDGQYFLLDEISLADDSVLERLNSVLESQRTILLAEKGVENSFVQATDGFQFFATMNPGGDYGKRELSPALRNRFTEIWVPSLSDQDDVLQIVAAKLNSRFESFAKTIVQFAEWFGQNYRSSASTSISVRDVLAWVKFMNHCDSKDLYFCIVHGAAMVYIDTLGANPAALLAIDPASIAQERQKCLQYLCDLVQHDVTKTYFTSVTLINSDSHFRIGDFSIPKQLGSNPDPEFAFEAPTTKSNAMRVIRALQVQKPILIEGSPGVGKTTLIAALSRACNRPLTRINLSEQTDLMDLFGSDVPVEGAEAGHFAWRDAPFLQAMSKGEWVLLDEMNLASQSVLEGLNACLDHRGEVYISELDQTFKRHPQFCVFATQNPHHQGGGRKGLPASFVNRFTVVYADIFRNEDLQLICKHNFPDIPKEMALTLIQFVSELENQVIHHRRFGSQGGPWELNLRDILRWLQLLSSNAPLLTGAQPSDFLNLIFRQRFRTPKDRQELDRVYKNIFGSDVPSRHFFYNISSSAYQVGLAYMPRDNLMQRLPFPYIDRRERLQEIESLMICAQQNIPCILVGSSGSGKTTALQHIAAMSGKDLVVFPLNSDIDTMDLVGGFEQVDPLRAASAFLDELRGFIEIKVLASLPAQVPNEAIAVFELLKDPLPSSSYFSILAQQLHALTEITSLPEFGNLAVSCQNFAQSKMTLENARFEWVDGVLIKALQQGKWLVLDNANLCSASVLDRLNSLLEPNGFLAINEHCGPDGEPKIIKPHPDFRIFLTMDSRFGELSRAMRNRAVEIFLDPLPSPNNDQTTFINPEADLQRFENLLRAMEHGSHNPEPIHLLCSVAMDNLSWRDMRLLQRFVQSFKLWVQEPSGQLEILHNFKPHLELYEVSANMVLRDENLFQNASNLSLREAIEKLLNDFSAKFSLTSAAFRDAQTIHPLQNSPLVPLLHSQDSEQVFWLGAVYDFLIDINTAIIAQNSQKSSLQTLKPSQMNRFQRSLVKSRVSAVAKDSTANISEFLNSCLVALQTYIHSSISPGATDQKRYKKAIQILLRYWWDTFQLAISPEFEEATFQAHIALGEDMISKINAIINYCFFKPLYAFSNGLRMDFNSGFKLTTGLSMEVMWKHFRPHVFSRKDVLDTLLEMEHLAARFDALKWKTAISVSDLRNIMTSLVKAYNRILLSDVDGIALVTTLSSEMDRLEKSIGNSEDVITPYFQQQFETIRKFQTLEMMRTRKELEIQSDVVVLANHATISEINLGSSTETSSPLEALNSLSGEDYLGLFTGSFSAKLLQKLNRIADVDLKSLKLLETEMLHLGQNIVASTAFLCKDQVSELNNNLITLNLSIIKLHGQDFQDGLKNWSLSIARFSSGQLSFTSLRNQQLATSPNKQPHFQVIFKEHLSIATAQALQARIDKGSRLELSALAWIHFAVGCIKLYVPDRAFDPDKRQKLERERHIKTKNGLGEKLRALQQFERIFSGQEFNLRCEFLKNEVSELGETPAILQEIYRPEISEIDQLHGEFSNLLKTIVGSNVIEIVTKANRNPGTLEQISLLQNNVSQIIKRLSGRFRAYNDLTRPAINMLRCLQIGLSLATLDISTTSPKNETCISLSKMIPFLGADRTVVDGTTISSQPMEYLAWISTTVAAQKLSSFKLDARQSLLKAFHGCYDQWMKRLETERLEAESKTGLYRFRGSAEDEDEEDQEQFEELFPTYESEEAAKTVRQSSTRDTAIEIAKVHSEIFLGGRRSYENLTNLIRNVSSRIGKLYDEDAHFNESKMTARLLPGTLLLLNDQIETLNSDTTPGSFNFYTDANLPESRKLVTLVHEIQSRFRELQAVDEISHMQPLEDVLQSCKELLEFCHTEPLAKIITKVEKVHTYMHEWQFGGWASRANSALTQYDNLTQTIVNWRRLELSTWAKLFDMETKKCEDDARSWWFVAYQVVIAAPMQISDSEDELRVYAEKLLKDLETYFSTAILGQFIQRLQLLKQLQKHLEFILLDCPSMFVIHAAVSNFIAIFSRYGKPVLESLKKGRATLEKSMRDILLLSRWNDINIVALRDSAKRSHHKLFKFVRKFRALLSQPVEAILKQGLPDEPQSEQVDMELARLVPYSTIDLSALAVCTSSVPNWSQKGKRFVNISKTVSMMANAAEISTAVDGAKYLNSFLANIISSTAELQKATPSILTDDNKEIVKHLKSRKRKLFADTLKELRVMGFKYNLGADALAVQKAISIVLANVGLLPDLEVEGLEYYFHKSIDLVPKAREATRQHSKDLSSAEVARSMGFLEGLLQSLICQHSALSIDASIARKLDMSLLIAKSLWAPKSYDIQRADGVADHETSLQWLPIILKVGINLVQIHSTLGKVDSKSVIEQLSARVEEFENHLRDVQILPSLPSGLTSTYNISLDQKMNISIEELSNELNQLSESRPDLSFIFNQMTPWLKSSSSIGHAIHEEQYTITDLDEKLSTLCDSALVAVEKYKKIIRDLPDSLDAVGWLAKEDVALSSSIKSLYPDIITGQLEESFKILRGVDLSDIEKSRTAGALFAVALPILQQYSSIYHEAVVRYARLHRATCKTTYVLSKTFIQIATQGFCTPSEKSDDQDGKTDKLEGGTGLGDGDGAEDIGKDIQDDENLDELAQEPNTAEDGDIEDEQDAVDMADGEMEGEMGEAEKGDDEEGSGDDEGGDEMDEEAGDVDDLDPTAIDEKMWDGDGEQAEKDQEGDESKGKQNKYEQVAAQENKKESAEVEEGDESDEEEAGAEQGEEIKQDEVEKHDSHAQEGEVLDLPDDMELDGNEDEKSVSGSEDGMDDLSDIDETKEDVMNDGNEEEGAENMDQQENQDKGSNLDVVDLDEEQQDDGESTQDVGEKEENSMEENPDDQGLLQDRNDDANADAENAVPSDAQGTGEDQEEASDEKTDSTSRAQREDGGNGPQSSEEKNAVAEDGEQGMQANGDAPEDADETQDSAVAQPFKKLGDALEQWHRQQTKIQDSSEQQDKSNEQDRDQAKESPEFQHLQDEDAQPDTQALGTATEEQAHALDESMAVDTETQNMPETFQPDEVENNETGQDNMDMDEPSTPEKQEQDATSGRAGAMIKQANDCNLDIDAQAHINNFDEEIEEVDDQLESTHLDIESLNLRSATEARQQWTHYEGITRDLSLSLTEQLRLILAPTLATKMRGDFRTGKRLNIKRIIPYIASQYKRDKIWMRRSVPSKRSYQIMLAVDDSKSMGESASGSLAFETLVMVSKSLSMLEVGEICVVGFGEDVKVAHDFDTPFSSDAGPKTLQRFGFQQNRTDVARLVRESIELFRNARAKASGPADLWQMELIISDGVCESGDHDEIRRLLREALEERIMMVFVIVDDMKAKRGGQSVMDLRQASFVNGTVVTTRYLDTFPFQYYIVVSDVKELPGVLATLLRQWFAEVVDSSN